MRVAAAAGRPAERSLAFSVAIELFEPLWRAVASPGLRAELADGPARAAVQLLDGLEPPRALDDGGYVVTRGMWALARRLAVPPPHAPGEPPASAMQQPRGLAIIVDDLHDVDGPTLGLLAYAANRLDSSPITIIAGCRSDVEPDAPAATAAIASMARVVIPEPLGARVGAEMVTSLLPDASPRFAVACVAACSGNPSLIHALVGGLADHGLTGSDADADRVGAGVPDRIAALTAERLSRLPAAARALARVVATTDRPLDLEQAAASTGLSTDAALEAFDALVNADILLADPQPTFAQPIVRTAVRASLTPGQRVRAAPLADRPAGVGRELLDALTPSEGRVAGLAAHGMTTRQIAETLFVTPKTVEFHLRNVYAKLGIPSTRKALARVLAGPEPVPSAE